MEVKQLTLAYASLFFKMGTEEHPRGSNSGEVVTWMLKREFISTPAPWCIVFISACYENACDFVGQPAKFNVGASSSLLYNSAKRAGCVYTDLKRVERGHFFLVRGGSTSHSHGGIVVKTSSTHFWTLEGNSNNQGTNEGQEVAYVRREKTPGKYDFINPY